MLVVGAGVAGLACARLLAGAGLGVVVLEARPSVGGRVRTLYAGGGEPVELGAQVLHATADGLLDQVLREHGLHADPLPGDGAISVVASGVREDAGALAPPPWAVEQALPRSRSVLDAIATLPDGSRGLARQWVEQVVGGEAERLDARGVAAAHGARQRGGERVVHGGCSRLAASLAEGLDVRLGQPVARLHWSEAGVRAEAGEDVRALIGVVTVPPATAIGTRLLFEPELPRPRREAAGRLASGDAFVVALTASHPARRSGATLLVDPPGGLWRTVAGSPVVVGQLSAGLAAHARRRTWDREQGEALLAALGEDVGDVVEVHLHDWGLDPWALGGTSLPVPGADAAAGTWAAPLGALFFAGEASAPPPLRGLVQGAVASGRRAAGQVLDRLRPAAG